MSGPDKARHADDYYAAACRRVLTSVSDPWWRVLDAECLSPAINAMGAVWTLYETNNTKGAK